MAKERLYLFDTTLRDGAQMNGVDFTVHDKRIIATLLCGIWPGVTSSAALQG